MSKAVQPPLGKCPECGVNMDLTGLAHPCRPPGHMLNEDAFARSLGAKDRPIIPPLKPIKADGRTHSGKRRSTKVAKRLPPMVHPEGEPIVGAVLSKQESLGEVAKRLPKETARIVRVAWTIGKTGMPTTEIAETLQKKADEVPAKKKRGRPKTQTAEELRTYQREYKRKWRANNGGKA